MFRSIKFKNFKALRDTTLPLSPFTLLLGPNGSGKTTVLQSLDAIAKPVGLDIPKVASVGSDWSVEVPVQVTLTWMHPPVERTVASWESKGGLRLEHFAHAGMELSQQARDAAMAELSTIRIYSLNSNAIASPVQVGPDVQIDQQGHGLAGALDQLRDDHAERFETLNQELRRWLPEYEGIEFDRPSGGYKAVLLRTKRGGHRIPAAHLSQGTLLALALLTLAYQPTPPLLIGLEEPDRGLHPRILRDLRDALYRLSYPDTAREDRKPVQVIVTTHSPYLLDLYREHPEEVVLAQKEGLDVHFERLADRPHFEEILGDAPLSEAWYSGILGGVPAAP